MSTKNTKISQTLWQEPVIPATREENHLNQGGGHCSEPRLHHYTPAWVTRAKLQLKKKESNLFLEAKNLKLRRRQVHAFSDSPTEGFFLVFS